MIRLRFETGMRTGEVALLELADVDLHRHRHRSTRQVRQGLAPGPRRLAAALDQKFLDAAQGDPMRASHPRKAYFARLALKSAQARRKGGEPGP